MLVVSSASALPGLPLERGVRRPLPGRAPLALGFVKRRKPTDRDLDARPWFVVLESGRTVEILDGPFFVKANAEDAAERHTLDGELDACIMQRFEPRAYTHAALYGPNYSD